MKKKKLSTWLEPNEARGLLAVPDKRSLQGLRDYCIIKLMLFTGLRRAELCSTNLGDFRLEGGITWKYTWGKGARERRCPIYDQDLLRSLKRYWKRAKIEQRPGSPAFVSTKTILDGTTLRITPKTLQKLLPRYLTKAGIKKNIHPHSLRHTALSRFYEQCKDLEATRAFAGHSSITTTGLYIHSGETRVRATLKTFSYDG